MRENFNDFLGLKQRQTQFFGPKFHGRGAEFLSPLRGPIGRGDDGSDGVGARDGFQAGHGKLVAAQKDDFHVATVAQRPDKIKQLKYRGDRA